MQNNSSGRKAGLPWSSGSAINRKKGTSSSKTKNNQNGNNNNDNGNGNNGSLHRQSSKSKDSIEVRVRLNWSELNWTRLKFYCLYSSFYFVNNLILSILLYLIVCLDCDTIFNIV